MTFTTRTRSRRSYYVVGVSDDGTGENYFDTFIERGYWRLIWPEDHPQAQRYIDIRNGMQRGDRIAIKKLCGRDEFGKIKILALGIVRDYEPETKTVYVDWIKTDYERKVPSKGCYAAAHGPYRIGNDPEWTEWLNSVFRL